MQPQEQQLDQEEQRLMRASVVGSLVTFVLYVGALRLGRCRGAPQSWLATTRQFSSYTFKRRQ